MGILGILFPFLILGMLLTDPLPGMLAQAALGMQTCLQAAVWPAGVAIASGYVDLHPSGPGMGR